MTYHFAAPEHHQTDEEKKIEVLKYLIDGCWLADTLHKETVDTSVAHEHDHVAFFVENNPYFDYPDAEIINQMVRDGFLAAHISPWVDGGIENRYYNLRHFRITDLGREHYAQHWKGIE